jgi:hypothetical protein
MRIVIALVALPVLIFLGTVQMRSKGNSLRRDFALIGTIALLIALYYR